MLGAELFLWAGVGSLVLLERHLAERKRLHRLAAAQQADVAAAAATAQYQAQQAALPAGDGA